MARGEQKRPTQEQRILALLQAAWPGEVSALSLSRIFLRYAARIFALRRKGWKLINRVEFYEGLSKRGWYRLCDPPIDRKGETR